MLNEYIKYMRLSRGYTQTELAKKLFIATSTLSHYETGARLVPHHILIVICSICEYNLEFKDLRTNKVITPSEAKRVNN